MSIQTFIYKYKTLYGSLIILLTWYLLYWFINSPIIPSPFVTIIEFFSLLTDDLLLHILVSLYRIILAVVISLVLGISVGLFLGINDKYDAWISPMIYLLYPVPKIAFLPVLMILFGLGDTSKVMLVTIIIFFQILVTTRDSVKGLSRELFFSIKSLGANKLQVYQHLIIPAVLPKLLTALRISIGTSIAVLFFAENFATTHGIGYFIMDSWTRVDYVQMFAGIIAISLLGLILFKSIDIMENRLCKWIRLEKINE
ncbi:ABC transporter permease [Aquibacillus koreensis]|uniref:ABC transporter permease n=1 Tax=Aquibacillus koreensis TaxID=279446 RepID=A0A9X3WLH4_9BACI|nr:ABC transporter permease [Aquibacillus koreensis]MCT2535039.1 ABC transporter permease [Aquibacillus koreensis]MDC3419326.1 ABC transporter permease [Aquibacillus koreensis]